MSEEQMEGVFEKVRQQPDITLEDVDTKLRKRVQPQKNRGQPNSTRENGDAI